MTEVITTMPVDTIDRPDNETTTTTENPNSPPQSPSPPPPRHRNSRDDERPPNRRSDYYDHRNNNNNRSPPNGPPVHQRVEYKRRGGSSMSPPPYRRGGGGGYDRRSPPYQKRFRRDDGGYDNRRGSPRGPAADRRFGNDHPGGYERDMGGRSGYHDDRPRGRFAGRSSGGYQGDPDWDSGRGGYNGHANTSREGLMSYKQFIQELDDDVLPSEAEHRYQEYKSEYISTQKRAYFDAHKSEDWLKDKYHPTNLLSVIERRNEVARKLAKEFLLDLENDSLDLGPGVTASSSYKSGQTSTPNSEDESDLVGKKRRHGRISSNQLLSAPKAHPVSSEHRRIQTDIVQAQALVKKIDLEKGIDDNMLSRADHDRSHREKSHSRSSGPVVIIRGSNVVKGLEGVELLDTLITYLWRIHGLDYYGMTEKSEAKGVRHVRPEYKNSDAKTSVVEWEDKLDSHWQDRLKGLDPLEIMTAKEKIEAAAAESLDPYVRKIQDEKYGWKYGCGAKGCTKLFHAAEFVHKHLKLKHPELSMEVTFKVREELYFQNYMNDEDAPGGKPIMQQSLPKERPQRHIPGIGDRLKDNRDFRRDRNNGGDRFDKGESPDSSEFQSNNDGGGHDDEMFNSFSGQGVHAQFPSDVPPPPVLMPVPGAGPLGPFIPAPPEFAMQMMRDQGGPRLQMTAPAPMIALPPPFRQNPRHLRSYQDLDAPEDEVTVIDYRSL